MNQLIKINRCEIFLYFDSLKSRVAAINELIQIFINYNNYLWDDSSLWSEPEQAAHCWFTKLPWHIFITTYCLSQVISKRIRSS